VQPEHARLAVESMMKLNTVGAELAKIDAVTAMTDVTGFGLLGHLLEMCQGSNLAAVVNLKKVPLLDPAVINYLEQDCVPGGSLRSWQSIERYISDIDAATRTLLCDPQTSGGLLISVEPESADVVSQLLQQSGCYSQVIGELLSNDGGADRSATISVTV